MVLSCHKISKAYGTDEIIKDVSFQIEQGEKAAIIGNNGAGKSTLLKIITGEITPDDGEVVTAKDTVMGYLAQYQGQDEEGTMLDIVLSAREDLIKEEASIREMEARMEQIPQGELDAFMERYHSQIRHFDQAGGYTFRSEAAGILKGLGFSESDFSKTMDMLSGGQKTRVSLAKLLVLQPDILLLDEPINHLDLSSIQWLEDFLQGYRGAVLIVAHDRYFLDRIVTKVIDISFHRAKVYRGNYTEYAAQRELERITLQNSYEKQQREIAHQQEVIDKLKSYNREKSVRRAESRQKMLDKMERLEAPQEENSRMQLEHLKKRVEEIFAEADKELIFRSMKHRNSFYSLLMGKRAKALQHTPNYAAAVFLLSADEELWDRVCKNVLDTGIYFDRIRLGGVTLEQYILFHAAKDVYNGTKHIRLSELTDRDLIPDEILRLIVNAFVIEKCGVEIVKQEVWNAD